MFCFSLFLLQFHTHDKKYDEFTVLIIDERIDNTEKLLFVANYNFQNVNEMMEICTHIVIDVIYNVN